MEENKTTKTEYALLFREYPDVVTVEQLAQMLAISKKLAYRLISEGKMMAVRIGREYKIPKLLIIQYLLG